MIAPFLYRFSGRLPCRIIADGDRPYLERYYLGTVFGMRAYLHRFVASDPDRGLHNHPWPWAASLVLSGDYFEHRRDRKWPRLVRWANWITGDTFHRVVMPADRRECWTLFIHRTAYTKPWGFWRTLDGAEGAALWEPWTPPPTENTGPGREWWLTAPRGVDEPRRMPA